MELYGQVWVNIAELRRLYMNPRLPIFKICMFRKGFQVL